MKQRRHALDRFAPNMARIFWGFIALVAAEAMATTLDSALAGYITIAGYLAVGIVFDALRHFLGEPPST